MPHINPHFLTCVALLAVSACAIQENGNSLLVKGTTIIDPSEGVVLENQCIWIVDDRIDRILPCKGDSTASRVIEANESWVIPGLWDMHVHALWDRSVYRDFFADFVAYGVVGVRDMGGDPDVLLEARSFLSHEQNIGPELIAAGYVLDGPLPVHPDISVGIYSAEDGAKAVDNLDSIGADFVKIYSLLPKAAATGVFEEARRRGLKVVGHLPGELELSDAIDSGMAGIEHMAVEIGGLCDVDDAATCGRIFRMIRDANVYLTPTLLTRRRPGTQIDPHTVGLARIADMPKILAQDWMASLETNLQERPASYFENKAAQYVREQRLTELAIASNSLILVGTDTGDFLIPPGSSIHEELELLVSAGMSEIEALFAATGRAGDFLGLEDRGRIRAGNIADLIILKSNPLDDIRNTRDIDSVILKGRLLNSVKLKCSRSRIVCD